MRIFVATDAAQILPVINHCRLRRELRGLLVTVATRDGDVPAGEQEMCVPVMGQRKRGWSVSLQIVASVAGVEVWGSGKLAGVLITVAIRTLLELHFEQCVPATGNMALRALHPGMSALQGVGSRGVILHRERRWFPAFDGVT